MFEAVFVAIVIGIGIGIAIVIVWSIVDHVRGDDSPFFVVESRQVVRPPEADALYDGIYDSFVEKDNEGDDRR
jgi:hypothetical protein